MQPRPDPTAPTLQHRIDAGTRLSAHFCRGLIYVNAAAAHGRSLLEMLGLETLSLADLRRLSQWYRALAEQAGSPVIWETRLHTAETLEAEACRREAALSTHEPE